MGNVTAALRDTGMFDTTLIIFYADNVMTIHQKSVCVHVRRLSSLRVYRTIVVPGRAAGDDWHGLQQLPT